MAFASTPTLSSDLSALPARIADRTATVAVVGVGSAGVRMLVAAAAEGFRVIAVDPDGAKVHGLRNCLLIAADVIVVAVPDPSMVRRALEDVAAALRPGQLVVLESTTDPGTTEALVRPILEATGLVAGRDFAFAVVDDVVTMLGLAQLQARTKASDRPHQPRFVSRPFPSMTSSACQRSTTGAKTLPSAPGSPPSASAT